LNDDGAPFTLGSMTKLVLVVEDDASSRFALVELLQSSGFVTLAARDGVEALAMLESSAILPCAIVLDLMMPNSNGWNFRRQQFADPRFRNIPVIVISSMDDPPGMLGTAAYLRKPIDQKRLLELVGRFSAEP
jgi:CheY-like chemotaxis protein